MIWCAIGTPAVIRTRPVHASIATWGLPDDELTQEWLQQVQEYRAECDAADRARLGAAAPEETPLFLLDTDQPAGH